MTKQLNFTGRHQFLPSLKVMLEFSLVKITKIELARLLDDVVVGCGVGTATGLSVSIGLMMTPGCKKISSLKLLGVVELSFSCCSSVRKLLYGTYNKSHRVRSIDMESSRGEVGSTWKSS